MAYPDDFSPTRADAAMGVYRFAEDIHVEEPDAPDLAALLAEQAERASRDAFYRLGVWAYDVGRIGCPYMRGSLEARAWTQGYTSARDISDAREAVTEAEALAVSDEIENNQHKAA